MQLRMGSVRLSTSELCTASSSMGSMLPWKTLEGASCAACVARTFPISKRLDKRLVEQSDQLGVARLRLIDEAVAHAKVDGNERRVGLP